MDLMDLFDDLPETCSLDKKTWSCLITLVTKAFANETAKQQNDIQLRVDNSVKQYFQDLNSRIDSRIDSLERDISEIKSEVKDRDIMGRIESIEMSLEAYSQSVASVQKHTLPGLVDHFNCAVTALAINNLDISVHRRKWTLIVSGIKGKAGESSDDTRSKLCTAVNSALGIQVSPSDFAACHRLDNGRANSAIHARFVDLSKRDVWLANARKLSKLPHKDAFSFSVDVPPCLRKVRKELADLRKGLSPTEKRQSFIKHLPTFPYFELVIRGDNEIRQVRKHSWSKQEIALASLPAMLAECASLNYTIPVKALSQSPT